MQYIDTYCKIERGRISVNGKESFALENEPVGSFFKAAYKNLKLDHGKFYKMDRLSQLAFLAAESIFSQQKVEQIEGKDIAIVLSNRASSLESDRKHQQSIQDPNERFARYSLRYNEKFYFLQHREKHLILLDQKQVLTNK